jgi:hypothetical protein
MSAAAQPQILAEASGVVVAVDGTTVVVVDRRLRGLATTIFVLAILTFITGSMGILFAVDAAASDDGNRAFGAVLLGVALVAAGFLIAAVRAVAARRKRPLSDFQPVAVLDLSAGQLRDGAGRVVAPLAHVRLVQRMQLASSSPKLVAETPGGSLLIARGNPFAGGLGNLRQVLAGYLPRQG